MSTKARTSNSSRASTKIALGFAAVALAAYFGHKYWANQAIADAVFPPITPTDVNIVGIDTSKGYRIIVANGVAQVVEGGIGEFESSTDDTTEGPKKRVPIKDMLQGMQGDEDALSHFVMTLNEMREDDLPPNRVYWTADEIKKAVGGDAALRTKLERDLNVKLDGTALPELRPSVLDTGIVIKAPVDLAVPSGNGQAKLTATVLIPYQARLMKTVFQSIAEKPNIDRSTMAGYYEAEAKALLQSPEKREDVAKALENLINDEALRRLADLPEKVIRSSKVVINGDHIEGASYEGYDTPRGTLYTVKLDLTDEGRKRLWKYSQGKVGSQLLLTVNGVAIAAPRISHELTSDQLSVTQILLDERYVRDAVDLMNKKGSEK